MNRRDTWQILGPEWSDDDLERRNTAKQRDILRCDLEFAAQWADTMAALVTQNLPDAEFTAARLQALHEWERARKLAQKKINYRFDPLRRSHRLVSRDSDRAHREATPEFIASLRDKLRAARDAFREQHEPPSNRTTSTPSLEFAAPSLPPTLHPGLRHLDEETRNLYARLAPHVDLASTPDDELRAAWRAHNPGMSDNLMEVVIADINKLPS
ncbi:hypothetical protein [Microbacterium sp. Clip185]|uniref:hypothetical protein n=1 Tax=Microbacterium sp. Clip185 TaxID=3025663 RepID=UPI002365CDE4|nr:hypothetical protein [Microbacterium sp. Clip185]WDG17480.1 hypothetical protein PQV94_12740 [Microbacterium sp. Clip185]